MIVQADFDALYAEMTEAARVVMPELAEALALESDPMVKILQIAAYDRMLDRARLNDGARANMLALATGADLDQLAAFWGVARLVVTEADATARPPGPAVMEDDEALRRRTQLTLEGHSTAGPRGAYLFHALSADGGVKDVGVMSPTPGQVAIAVLGRLGDGTADAGLVDAVGAAVNAEDVRPLCDRVTVESAQIVAFTVTAELVLYDGPDASLVMAAAETELSALLDRLHALGHDVTRAAIFGALARPGVQNVHLTQPAADIPVAWNQAPHCAGFALSFGGRDV